MLPTLKKWEHIGFGLCHICRRASVMPFKRSERNFVLKISLKLVEDNE